MTRLSVDSVPAIVQPEYFFRFISPCNCWAAEFGYTDDFQNDEHIFRFQVTLLGLGSFGPSAGGINYTGVSRLPSAGLERPTAVGPASPGFF